MNIGERKRTIEVEPVTLLAPEPLPVDEPVGEPELQPTEPEPSRT